MHCWSVFLITTTLVTVWLLPLQAQTLSTAVSGPVQRLERFAGTTRLGGSDTRIAIDTWLLPERYKVEALELPLRGLTVLEVRGGSVVTIIDGQRRKRQAGEFWTVPAGVQIGLETEDDSAAIQTTVIAE